MFREDSLARIRPTTTSKRIVDLDSAVPALVRELRGFPGRGRVQITSVSGDAPRSWTIALNRKSAALDRSAKSARSAPAFEILATDDTLGAILSGELSPLTAFAENRLRVRGNLAFGRAVLRYLAVHPGMTTEICR